jgi:DNA-directed RNA polymerase subunit M/transcription elongation factor TFIIS
MEYRLKWIQILQKHSNKHFARKAEHYAYTNRQKIIEIGPGIEIMRYGNIDLLDLDAPESHHEAAYNHYCQSLRKIVWMLKCGNIDHLSGAHVQQWFKDEDEKILLHTKHAEWEKKFYSQQELARSVLAGKYGPAPTSGIFQCSKCNSFDIDTEQKQTRSADEPMTIFCTCNSCGKRFIR